MKLLKNLALVGFLGVFNVSAQDAAAPVENTPVENTSAENTPVETGVTERSGWFFSGGMMNFDGQVASAELIEDDGFYLNAGWEGNKGAFAYAVGFNLIFLSDDASFSQSVVDIWGNSSTASSTAEAYGLFGELGYSHLFESGKQSFDIMAGLELLTAERGIGNCSNCYSEDIDLSSGLYIKPKFRIYSDSNFVFSFEYRYYLSGDIENGIGLNFAWTR